ncbi:MAG: CsbD family protein [Candidatus Caenarcaniphilales bacterium]|jgi:uncharacterized protein YjbJ (UPF0337 family)|nr:CsbD family protein [Candidatus Caenarcaniphilales bacterium]
MNKDTINGNLKMFAGQAKKQWGKLTNNDCKEAEGRMDLLAGKLQERYGIAKEEAAKQVQKWSDGIKRGLNA